MDSNTLTTKHTVRLLDPRNNGLGARITDDATSTPMVAPDGDVYFGVFGSSGNGSRGFLLHFSGDLQTTKTPGAFGWDYTPGIVPASMVPSYTGNSSYLLFCKYNNYISQDGDGVNRVAILDPNATQTDPHSSAPGLVEMREVLTLIGPTPDDTGGQFPFAVQEFCINAPAVNPATNSVFFDSEDGHIYRWNLVTNVIDQAVVLSPGLGQPYVPTVIGPDGTLYTLNGGNFFAVGTKPGVAVTISSSSPDVQRTVVGNPITFTATVAGSAPTPTGTVTFSDLTYNGLTPVTTILASNVPLDGNGRATVTT
ncbi:MAG TPA: Ig-like domain-containing protein, partial [Pyrinomonadaceae bacterium]